MAILSSQYLSHILRKKSDEKLIFIKTLTLFLVSWWYSFCSWHSTDVDYHAGNGTYDIFKDRSDVVFCSIHGDPLDDFPYFFGFADEEGESEGTGYSRNVPLPIGTDFSNYAHVLDDCIRWALEKGCEAMVVSLGLDTFESDPIGNFKFTRGDYFSLGLRLGSLQLPTCFVLEGGYVGREHISNPNSSPLGDLVFDVLNGFESVDTV